MAISAKGLEGIVANESRLSHVEGDEGRLSYVGYTIDDLVEYTTFEQIVYLLHRGELPNQAQLDELTKTLREKRSLPDGVIEFIKAAPKDANPMNVLRTGVSMLGLYDTRGQHQNRALNEERALSIIAKIPLIVAYFHLARQGKELIPFRQDLSGRRIFST